MNNKQGDIISQLMRSALAYLFLQLSLTPCMAIEVSSFTGERYEVEVPDTLDLGERARLAVNGMTNNLDPEHEYEMFFLVRITSDPPYMMHFCLGDMATCTPKYLESLPMMRVMSGSEQNLDVEKNAMETLLSLTADDGLYYVPAIDIKETPWRRRANYPIAQEDMATPSGNARLMLAMMAWHQRDSDPAWMERIRKMVDGLAEILIYKDDYAYIPEGRVGLEFSYLKETGWEYDEEPKSEHEGAEGTVHSHHGRLAHIMSRWYAMSGDEKARDTAEKVVNFIVKRKMWGADAGSQWIDGPEHAHFYGHFHGNLTGLRGVLEFAQVTNNEGLKQFVRDGYGHARSWGIGRIGSFGDGVHKSHTEGCAIADITALGIKLSDYGVGDYWDDVDQYVRNHLVEQQLVRADLLENVSRAAVQYPDALKQYQHRPFPWGPEAFERVIKVTAQEPTPINNIEDLLGLFAAFSDATVLPYTVSNGCCTANCTRALYYAWESIVRCEDDIAQVNLLLNRASPWLDIDSHLPYEGRVVIKNKTAKRLSVRIPRWVDKKSVNCLINGTRAECFWVGNYLALQEILNENDAVTIEFPMIEEVVEYTMPFDKKYTCTFRGNTLVDISPRDTNPTAYPIYLREHYRQTKAPMKKKTRFVADRIIKW